MYGKSESRDDYQVTPQPLAAMARDLPSGFIISQHSHSRSQLLYASSGVMTVTTEAGTWVVPPHRAVWVPSGTMHELTTSSEVLMRTVYVDPEARPELLQGCAVLTVSDLLRELILVAVKIPNDYDRHGRAGRIMDLILDELRPAAELPLHVPMPTDRRLKRICEHIFANPASSVSLSEYGSQFGASKRTLERLFPEETGLSFTLWRQQARGLMAIRLLAAGDPVTSVAMDVGYASSSAFSAMFRKLFGIPPSEYFEQPVQFHI